MITDLTTEDVELAHESLRYSHQRVRDAAGTPNEVRRAKLDAIEKLLDKLPKVTARIED